MSKKDFDDVIRAAEEALRAKTSSSQTALHQASSAMRNAVTALNMSEQEVANLRQVVKELKRKSLDRVNEGTIGKERVQLRKAQDRLSELSQNFRNLQTEVVRKEYERERGDLMGMPVAVRVPVRIDPMLASKSVVIAQLVMVGYAYGDAEDALDAVMVNDVALALEWLEERNVRKISVLALDQADSDAYKRAFTTHSDALNWTSLYATEDARIRHLKQPSHRAKTKRTSTTTTNAASRAMEMTGANQGYVTNERSLRGGGYSEARSQPGRWGRSACQDANELYTARKRAVTMLATIALTPPPTLRLDAQTEMAHRAITALARLADSNAAYLVLMQGGARCATDCLKIFASHKSIILECFDVLRGLMVNPSTMMAFKRQQRFRLLPKAICEAVYVHYDDMDVCSRAARALWAAATIGGAETQDRVVSTGAVDFIRDALARPKRDDPDGAHTKRLIGCLLALASSNQRIQDLLVQAGVRALIRKGLVEHSFISFHGEFASLRDWTKAEFSDPSPLPKGVKIDEGSTAVKKSRSAVSGSMIQRQTSTPRGAVAAETRTRTRGSNAKKRTGFSDEVIYAAKKRAITVMSAIAVNPPEKETRERQEEISFRCLQALCRLAQGNSAYLVLIHGGPRTAIDCLRLYQDNPEVVYAAFQLIRGLLYNPSTMMKFRKQRRFRIIPATTMDCMYRHEDNLWVKAEAAHLLWTYSGIGGPDAQDLVISVEFLPIIKAGLEEAREVDRTGDLVRKFIGCVLSLAKGNPSIQELLVREGMRGMVRKCLVEHSSISFDGEFADLRDWIRGDRGGASSAPPKRPREPAVERAERNNAEFTLMKGREENGHAVKLPPTPVTPRQVATQKSSFTTHEQQMAQRRAEHKKTSATSGIVDVAGGAVFTPDAGDGKSWRIEEAIRVLNSDTRELHSEASEALAEMFAASPPVGVEIIAKGGVAAVCNAVEAGHAAFAAGGCALLHMFATSEVTSRRVKADETVLSGRAPAAILGAMRRYATNAAVQQWGAMTLWALAKDNPRAKVAIMHAPMDQVTSSDALMHALSAHGKTSEAIAKALLGCMLTLAMNSPEWQERWVQLGAISVIVETLESHRGITFRGEFDGLRAWLRDNA